MLQLAITAGILFYLGHCCLGYWFYDVFGQPLFCGLIFGLVSGEMETCMILGGSIQLIYLGMIFAGGNLPADAALAACIAIPLALASNLSAEAAVVLAVPFGVLGAFMDQIRRTVNAFFIHKADQYAEEGNSKGIWLLGTVFPQIFYFILRFPFVFAAVYLGADAMDAVLTAVPNWVMHGLEVAGGLLPAMGFAIVIYTIGKKALLPYFFIGFFAVQYLEIPTMAAAIFGACIAVLVVMASKARREEAN